MKKFFKISTFIISSISLALFSTLGLSVLILGIKQTEEAITVLFDKKNYQKNYDKTVPLVGEAPNIEESKNEDEVLRTLREIEDRSKVPPLLVPSSGIAPRSAFLYTGPLSEGKHEGIDIWTKLNGTGMDGRSYGKGNPVYAACSGYVHNIWEENGDVVVICDELSAIYKDKVSSIKVKTLYGHMADQFSDKIYIYVQKGQRVHRGDLIGHQGNRCHWAPQNRVVHLHFGVYDISIQPQVPLDPTPYIGVSCTTLNQEFEAGVEN